ncbi:hypothetical protein AAG747_28615 [Rapidithrix thailandica]|uniref:Uncharacterized protein n=1 Tax=Rapidithrix thailandica TaxID=413964 RepID=A0AAW9SFQ9_9BACT
MQKFTECLNDLVDYFILSDILVLSEFQAEHNLSEHLEREFTTNESGDQAVESGTIIPLSGIENYPYTIYFNTKSEMSIFDELESELQFRKTGYILQVKSGELYLFTMPYLRDWTKGRELLKTNAIRPKIQLENGWYSVEISGGETWQEEGWEPTFEFRLEKRTDKPEYTADMNFRFTIHSREY